MSTLYHKSNLPRSDKEKRMEGLAKGLEKTLESDKSDEEKKAD